MNELDTAIYSQLGGTAVTNLLAGTASIYSWQAPDDASYPYIVFNDMSDIQSNMTAHTVHEVVYQVRAFAKTTMKDAKAIDNQIRLRLHNTALSITNFTKLKGVRESAIRFVENLPNGEIEYSAGALYRFVIERTA